MGQYLGGESSIQQRMNTEGSRAGETAFQNHVKEGEDPKTISEEQWKQRLTSEQFYVCRRKGTERAFTGKFAYHHEKGTYVCVCCGAKLFSSSTKFESGSGWPSFNEVLTANNDINVEEHVDKSYGMTRVEVTCKKCSSHLGHVFNDGPKPTGLRYCINSESLAFEPTSD